MIGRMMTDTGLDDAWLLERLTSQVMADEFFEAADADDFGAVARILRSVAVDEESIQMVLRKMRDTDGRF